MPGFDILHLVVTLALAPIALTYFRRRGQQDGERAVLWTTAAVLCGPLARAGGLVVFEWLRWALLAVAAVFVWRHLGARAARQGPAA